MTFILLYVISGGTSACKSAISSNMLTIKPKERKKHDRFNGMSEAEVIQRTIPDHLCDNLDIVIVSCKFPICMLGVAVDCLSLI